MRRGAVLANVAALGLSGCGGGSLSISDLRSDAAKICAAASAQTQRIPTPTSPSGGAAFLARGDTAIAAELKRLQALRPPSDAADAYASALSASAGELRELRATIGQLSRGGDPTTALKTLQRRLAPLEARANAAWQTLEISACQDR
jgi:hypothetical protein